MGELTHFDERGASRMVDVSAKAVTLRTARATGWVRMNPSTLSLLAERKLSKGDVLEVARLAGIMAAKRTGELIPLCHPLGLDGVELDLRPEPPGRSANRGNRQAPGPNRGGDGSSHSSKHCGTHDLRHVQGGRPESW